ncbi:MAG TPA: DUF1634 domain-containing protein [Terriglobales bacterium]|jgi:uncharacterized membrane protein|nr:DUF1634 domain-containing protein [Terriglobales bacterium]
MAAETDTNTGAWSDARLEIIIGNLLRIGVAASAAVVLAGGVLYLLKYGGEKADYRTFLGEPENLRSLSGIVRSAAAGHPAGIIQAGLLLLIATPIARVIFSAFGFLQERDYRYVLITLIVLAVLLYSILKPA